MADERRTTLVRCTIPQGVVLRREKWVDGPESGTWVSRYVGDPVTLKTGDNAVDAEFWQAWLAEHPDHPLLEGGALDFKREENEDDGQ